MPENWKTYALEEVVEKIIDYRGKTPLKSIKGVPLITAKVIKDGRINTPEEFIAEDMYEKWMTRGIPEIGDVVLTTEAPLGEVAQIKTRTRVALAQRVIALRGKAGILDNAFLKYFLQSPIGQGALRAKESGTTVFGIKQSELRELEIHAPDFSEQCRIGITLLTLDEKIELNMKMNASLEAIGQLVFKHWFVDYQFPGSDGELVDGQPRGWRVGKLGEVIELLYGKALKAEKRAEGEFPVVGSSGIVGFHNEFLVQGPGIVIGRKGTIGEVIWLDQSFFPIDTTFYVKDQLGVHDLFFHYFLLKRQYFKKIASDSAVPGLNRNEAQRNPVVIPKKESVQIFNELMRPIFEKRRCLNEEVKTLIRLRDSLLPRLMNGAVRVAE